MQLRAFPLRITGLEPIRKDCARCKFIGRGDDGQRYYIKRVSEGRNTPAAEYLCTEMAASVGLAVPPGYVALLDDEAVFASQEAIPVADINDWLTRVLSDAIPLPGLADDFSRWFAFDLFAHNPDRHIDNFIVPHDGSNAPPLIGIDFSEAWHVPGWPMQARLGACHTLDLRRVFAARYPLQLPAFRGILDKLAALNDDWMKDTLARMPDAWMDATLRSHMGRWWTQHRLGRIDTLRREHANDR